MREANGPQSEYCSVHGCRRAEVGGGCPNHSSIIHQEPTSLEHCWLTGRRVLQGKCRGGRVAESVDPDVGPLAAGPAGPRKRKAENSGLGGQWGWVRFTGSPTVSTGTLAFHPQSVRRQPSDMSQHGLQRDRDIPQRTALRFL
ncbi:hypothetical protein MHYP_G00215740 [Metynnis hypsauchen]